jgi:hypothetical protein
MSNNPSKTRLDQIDGLLTVPTTKMEEQELLVTADTVAAAEAVNKKRKIDDSYNVVNNGDDGRTPLVTTSEQFVQAPSTRPPRWNDVEVSSFMCDVVCILYLLFLFFAQRFFFSYLLPHTG